MVRGSSAQLRCRKLWEVRVGAATLGISPPPHENLGYPSREGRVGTITLGPTHPPREKQRKSVRNYVGYRPPAHEKPAIPGKEGVVDGFECLVARSGFFFGS